MRKTLLAGILAGLVVFVWQTIAWTVLPHHLSQIQKMQDSRPLLSFMESQNLESGVYMLPSMNERAADPAAFDARYTAGPVVPFLVYHRGGMPLMMVSSFIVGLLIVVASGWLVAEMLLLAKEKLPTKGKQMFFVLGFAAFAALMGPLMNANWMYFPWGYELMTVLDLFIEWALAGWVIVAMINRTPKAKGEAVPAA